jgi:hypothetical protein
MLGQTKTAIETAWRERITESLAKNDLAVLKAILIVDRNQTQDEQNSEHTKYRNGMGWRPAHARMGSSYAKQFREKGYLTTNQIGYFKKMGKEGMRIALYWRQLMDAATSNNSITLPAGNLIRKSKPRPAGGFQRPYQPRAPFQRYWNGPRMVA